MKLFLCCFLLFLSTSVSFADDLAVRGDVNIGKHKKSPPATAEQIDEALQISTDCKKYEFTNTHYDCDCVGLKFLDLRRAKGNEASTYNLRDTAQKQCPNTPAMAGKIYTRCLGWAPQERGEDYDAFCSCYGSEFAKLYGKNPSDNQLILEAQMTTALSSCHSNSVNEDLQDKDALIRTMKENGTYDQLFPGASAEDEKGIILVPRKN